VNKSSQSRASDQTSSDQQAETPALPENQLPAPQGIGMAVAFDWGLVVQILVMPFLPLLLGNKSSFFPFLKFGTAINTIVSFIIVLPFAALLAIFGEGVRRGWRWTRPVQVAANVLLFLAGVVSLYNLWQSSKQGNYWPVVTEVILVIFSPLIAWRMSRPATRVWFARVTSREARVRHGGAWPWLIAIWAIVGGILQAIAASR